MGYARSPFPDFEIYLRILVGLDEDDIQMTSKIYQANFVTYVLDPCIHNFEDLQEAVYPLGDLEGTLKIEDDDLIKKTKLLLTRFGSTLGTLRFDEKPFFKTFLGLALYWDCKPTNVIHADSPGVYSNDKVLNLSTIKKILLRGDCIDGSIQNGV